MNQCLQENFDKIPSLPQRQDSEQAQLRDLIQVANRLGMYDAADFLKCYVLVNGPTE
jgi:hypothetical protein